MSFLVTKTGVEQARTRAHRPGPNSWLTVSKARASKWQSPANFFILKNVTNRFKLVCIVFFVKKSDQKYNVDRLANGPLFVRKRRDPSPRTNSSWTGSTGESRSTPSGRRSPRSGKRRVREWQEQCGPVFQRSNRRCRRQQC